MKKILLAIFCSFFIVFLGCQATKPQQSKSVNTQDNEVVMCSKCKKVWLLSPDKNVNKTYGATETTQCESCESAVKNLLKTGKLEHTCTHCGDAIQHCPDMKNQSW